MPIPTPATMASTVARISCRPSLTLIAQACAEGDQLAVGEVGEAGGAEDQAQPDAGDGDDEAEPDAVDSQAGQFRRR